MYIISGSISSCISISIHTQHITIYRWNSDSICPLSL